MSEHQAIAGKSFEVRVAEDGETTKLSLRGELDLAKAPELKDGLDRALGDGAAEVVVDLSELTFIDSTGIALLVLAKRGDRGGRLCFLPSNSDAVSRVLALTGINETLGLAARRAGGHGPS
jgi:anti-sigma B factor antagonist